MARIRSIKPEAFHSESLSQCSVEAERTFWGMSTMADDEGRLKDQPAVINGALWCMRPAHTADHVDDEISQLVTSGALCRYVSADGKRLIHFPSWDAHQSINRPSVSKLPACPKHGSDGEDPDGLTAHSVSPTHARAGARTPEVEQGRERKGTGEARERAHTPEIPVVEAFIAAAQQPAADGQPRPTPTDRDRRHVASAARNLARQGIPIPQLVISATRLGETGYSDLTQQVRLDTASRNGARAGPTESVTSRNQRALSRVPNPTRFGIAQ